MRFVLGVLVGAVMLWWAGRGLDWQLVSQTVAAVHQAWVAVAVIGVVAVALAKAARWGALYRLFECRPSYGSLFWGLMAAQAVNLIIPIRLGELIRLGWMKQVGQSGTITLSTIVIEKVIDLLVAGLMAMSLVALAVAPSWLRSQASSMFLISLTLILGLILIWRLRVRLGRWLAHGPGWANRLPARWQERSVRVADSMLAALSAMADWYSLLPVLWWTMIVWLLSLLTILALFAAFKLHLPIVAAVLIMLAVSFVSIPPSPPALVGAMQMIAVLVLGQYDVARPVAVGFGSMLSVVTVAPLLVLGSWAACSHIVSVVARLRHPTAEELRQSCDG
jgi:uncharacterized protein (TIRG00374 family)